MAPGGIRLAKCRSDVSLLHDVRAIRYESNIWYERKEVYLFLTFILDKRSTNIYILRSENFKLYFYLYTKI